MNTEQKHAAQHAAIARARVIREAAARVREDREYELARQAVLRAQLRRIEADRRVQ